MSIRSTAVTFTLLTSSWLATGCATLDRMGAKMDMAVNRVAEQGQHEYEGKLESMQKMGAMTAIQLSGGKIYDVVELSPGLVPGDVVRVYRTPKGYEARLWKQAKFNPVISEGVQPIKPALSGS